MRILFATQILAGRDNAWAKAVARGEEAASLDIAVEHDLDVLQRLAVAESTLASWIAGSGSRVPEAWLKAGEHLDEKDSPKRLQNGCLR